jgi:hypothetical protein
MPIHPNTISMLYLLHCALENTGVTPDVTPYPASLLCFGGCASDSVDYLDLKQIVSSIFHVTKITSVVAGWLFSIIITAQKFSNRASTSSIIIHLNYKHKFEFLLSPAA